jgi:hypothetical protein
MKVLGLAGVLVSALVACGDDPVPVPEISGGEETSLPDGRDSDVVEPADADKDIVDSASNDTSDSSIFEIDVGPEVSPASGFPAQGLLIRVLEPGAHGVAETLSPNLILSGVLFGDAITITWQLGDKSGEATPRTFWQAGPIALKPGDNRVTVTATDGTTTATDTVVVTYNPAFKFDAPLALRPSAMWLNDPTLLVFNVATTRYSNVDTSTLEVVRVDAEGRLLSELGPMKDDGKVSTSGDEIAQDGVFTWAGELACTSTEPLYFRASVEVGAPQRYTAVSSTVRVDCLERLSRVTCATRKALIDGAAASLAAGSDPDALLTQLRADPDVRTAGAAADGSGAVWLVFRDDMLGAVIPASSDTRGGGAAAALEAAARLQAAALLSEVAPLPVGSKRTLFLSPRLSEFGDTDEGPELAATFEASTCPHFELDGVRANEDASLAALRRASEFGVVSIATHGAVLFEGLDAVTRDALEWRGQGQEVLVSGTAVACDNLLEASQACRATAADPLGGCPIGTRCLVTRGVASDEEPVGEGLCVDDTQVDLRRGRVVMTNLGHAVTPSFFSAWRGRGWPASLVHLGACSSMRTGSLASALYAAGARAVSGFSGPVSGAFAKQQALALLSPLTEGTVGDRPMEREDPAHPGTFHRLFGARNLSLARADLINGDFEDAGLVGWRGRGDGRAMTRFGDVEPVSGKGMGLVSTGLGFAVETGTLEQTFCVPADKSRVVLYWKFMSEEFKEWCGTEKFQDRFSASILGPNGADVRLVEVKVDDLCGYGDGTCRDCPSPRACDAECAMGSGCYLAEGGGCTGEFNCQCGRNFVGLNPSSVGFDYGGVYEVGWQRAEVDVSSLAGAGPVTLVLSVEDSGDSSFDTAVLVDAIAFD